MIYFSRELSCFAFAPLSIRCQCDPPWCIEMAQGLWATLFHAILKVMVALFYGVFSVMRVHYKISPIQNNPTCGTMWCLTNTMQILASHAKPYVIPYLWQLVNVICLHLYRLKHDVISCS